MFLFQSTHPTRGCDIWKCIELRYFYISIHAPHEGVRQNAKKVFRIIGISIHAPHEGVRRFEFGLSLWLLIFQSTHPTRGCDMIIT